MCPHAARAGFNQAVHCVLFQEEGKLLTPIKVKKRAAMLRGLSLILRSFFVPLGAPEAVLCQTQSRNGQAGPHHGNCVHQECLSVPAVMWQLCFCNFSSFQPTRVIHQEALAANLGGSFGKLDKAQHGHPLLFELITFFDICVRTEALLLRPEYQQRSASV